MCLLVVLFLSLSLSLSQSRGYLNTFLSHGIHLQLISNVSLRNIYKCVRFIHLLYSQFAVCYTHFVPFCSILLTLFSLFTSSQNNTVHDEYRIFEYCGKANAHFHLYIENYGEIKCVCVCCNALCMENTSILLKLVFKGVSENFPVDVSM